MFSGSARIAANKGIESIWILGDTTLNMLARYRANAKEKAQSSYISQNFELTITASGGNSNIPSPIARIINGFIRNYNQQHHLPKWIILIPETDIINMFQIQDGLVDSYKLIIEYIASELERLIKSITDLLPEQSEEIPLAVFDLV